MNNPLNTPHSPNELVLRLIGGERDGHLFSVQNEKCLLTDLSPGIENAENYRCVIFRGEKGVAYRSYSDHVLCNGAKVSVQWLRKGDLIKVTDNFSVEVVQLGFYTKNPAAAPTADRQPMNTVAMPESSTTPLPNGPVVARQESSTIPLSTPAPAAPNAYATPSVQFPAGASSPTGEAPKFKPATANLRTPSVTAPLPTHQIPTETPAPAASVSRMPVVTQALDLAAGKKDSQLGNVVETPSLDSAPSAAVLAEAPSVEVPSPPSNATIDSLSERLSNLVNSAGEDGSSEFGVSEPTATAPPTRPSVSTMPIEPTHIETAAAGTGAQSDAVVRQPAPTLVQPIQPSASTTPQAGRAPVQTIPVPPVTPTVTAAEGSSTDAAPQTSVADSAAQRRSALESYFSKSGITLSDAITPPEDEVVAAEPVSPEATPVEPAASAEPAALITPVASVEATTVTAEQSNETSASAAEPASPEFDLDSVLANLETGSPTSSEQPPVAAAPVSETPVSEAPVVASPVTDRPMAETFVTDTPVSVSDAIVEQPSTGTDSKDESSVDATSGEQGGQLESFALLQSLGLDTSGLGQIKQELTEAPLREELESISLTAEPQAEPEASEPEKVESVADVLARMQNAGSLQDFKASDEAESSSEGIVHSQAPTTPPPASPPVASTEPPVNEGGAAGESTGTGEEDGSVEDYMSQLLNRMRGDSEPTSGEVAQQQQDRAVEKIAAEQQAADSSASTEPEKVKKLTQEEFVPKQKAVRMQSLDSLREIANSNAREAFRDSLARERKVSTQTKLTLSMVSLAFAVLFFLMSYMKDQVNFWGVVFGIGFLIIGLLTARAYLSEKKLDESILSD